jgi:hypothetical protein
MAVYYFDLRDGSEIVPDEEGMELSDLVAVQEEAARALANLSWDTVRNFAGAQSHTMSVEVRTAPAQCCRSGLRARSSGNSEFDGGCFAQ